MANRSLCDKCKRNCEKRNKLEILGEEDSETIVVECSEYTTKDK